MPVGDKYNIARCLGMPTNLLSDERDECLKHLRYITCRVVTPRPFSHIEKYIHDIAPEKYPVRVFGPPEPTIAYDRSWNLVLGQSSLCRTRHRGFQGSCKSSGSSLRRASDFPASNLENMSAQLRIKRGSMPGRMHSS
jgi:hypothetical protein